LKGRRGHSEGRVILTGIQSLREKREWKSESHPPRCREHLMGKKGGGIIGVQGEGTHKEGGTTKLPSEGSKREATTWEGSYERDSERQKKLSFNTEGGVSLGQRMAHSVQHHRLAGRGFGSVLGRKSKEDTKVFGTPR